MRRFCREDGILPRGGGGGRSVLLTGRGGWVSWSRKEREERQEDRRWKMGDGKYLLRCSDEDVVVEDIANSIILSFLRCQKRWTRVLRIISFLFLSSHQHHPSLTPTLTHHSPDQVSPPKPTPPAWQPPTHTQHPTHQLSTLHKADPAISATEYGL